MSLWAVYETLHVYQYSRQLQEDHKDCITENPNQIPLFLGTLLISAVAKFPVQRTFMRFVEPVIPVLKFPLGSEVRMAKAEMTAERVYRLLIYIAFTAASYLILKDSPFL